MKRSQGKQGKDPFGFVCGRGLNLNYSTFKVQVLLLRYLDGCEACLSVPPVHSTGLRIQTLVLICRRDVLSSHLGRTRCVGGCVILAVLSSLQLTHNCLSSTSKSRRQGNAKD